ncbi:MAG: oligosaccharide flippase family protein [Oscillospiraceae bacterium]|nr:oligosaccharide flippase family protein [Oscillospiraceae bacterium]
MNSKSITKNVVFLTVMNVLMQSLGLIVNVCITRQLGTATIGSVSLLGTFYGLLCIIASANVFVCTSRLGAGEEGRGGNSDAILRYALIFSLTVTAFTCIGATLLCDYILSRMKTTLTKKAVMLLLCGLPLSSIGAAYKGFFNSKRMQYIPAFADISEFLVKSGVLMFFVQFFVKGNRLDIYSSIALSTICGESVSLILMLVMRKIKCEKSRSKVSMSFGRFVLLSVPIMLNSYVCAFLSSANDFLMPLTLRQSGSNMTDALSKFGIFEAIVLPILFFPSCVISSLSSIILPEVSRALGKNRTDEVNRLTGKAAKITLTYSIFIACVIYFKGSQIAQIISNEPLAGKTLCLLCPIIPFIYLEIILEAIIKGLGKHGFSSINYLAEYVVRISLLLVCVPLMGFGGVIISYAMSNICGNTARIVMLTMHKAMTVKPFEYIVLPFVFSLVSVSVTNVVCSRIVFADKLIGVIIFILSALLLYMLMYSFFEKAISYKNSRTGGTLERVHNT